MQPEAKLGALVDLAEQLGLTVRHVGSAGGGAEHPGGAVVRLRGREIVFLDPAAPLADQVDVLASALRGRAELQDCYLRPEIRELLE
ncbi:MAG: hypothetical protein J7M21_05015 [Planctomycetes bacterium]|nr:hypothetical protein [Planctomycetota bacterium]